MYKKYRTGTIFKRTAAIIAAITLSASALILPCGAVSDWAVNEILTAQSENLIPDYSDDVDWEAPATRLDTVNSIVKLIEKLCGKKITTFLRNNGITKIKLTTFSDCDNRNVLYCNALGIIKGVEENKFCPDDGLTRAQLAVIINRVAELFGVRTDIYSNEFSDLDGHWASSEIGWQYRAGVMKGTSADTFDPDSPVTYEQLTAIMLRAYNSISEDDGDITYYEDEFYSTEITDSVFGRINGKSYRENDYISRDDLRYVHLLHKDADGNVHVGEMICHKEIAEDIVSIMLALYEADYPIESVRLVDEFNADDEESMKNNNTSCFNYRPITNSANISYHAFGLAIDINPMYNPYVYDDGEEVLILPDGGEEFTERDIDDSPYMIKEDDICVKLFKEKGFRWGGDWENPKDYQHFEIIE